MGKTFQDFKNDFKRGNPIDGVSTVSGILTGTKAAVEAYTATPKHTFPLTGNVGADVALVALGRVPAIMSALFTGAAAGVGGFMIIEKSLKTITGSNRTPQKGNDGGSPAPEA